MDSEIMVALIALLGTAGRQSEVLVSSKLTNYRLRQLENRVEEQIKVINHRIGDLKAREERGRRRMGEGET